MQLEQRTIKNATKARELSLETACNGTLRHLENHPLSKKKGRRTELDGLY